MGPTLLDLLDRIEFVHFAEMGLVNETAKVEIGIVEGSVSTQHEIDRLKRIRGNSGVLVSIGACATSGGIQALRNDHDGMQWLAEVYPNSGVLDFQANSKALSEFVLVDYQLWGCPINAREFVNLISQLLLNVRPRRFSEKLCMECKRQQKVCTLVSQGQCCMGPITRSGCGVLCPGVNSPCYGCFGPAENSNASSMLQQFVALGLNSQQARQRIRFIHSQNREFDSIKA